MENKKLINDIANFIIPYAPTFTKEEIISEITDYLKYGELTEMRESILEIGNICDNSSYANDLVAQVNDFAEKTYPTELTYSFENYYLNVLKIDDSFKIRTYDSDYLLKEQSNYDNLGVTIYEAISEFTGCDVSTTFFQTLAEEIDSKEFTNTLLSLHSLDENSENLEVDGHTGVWYVIASETIDDTKYFLLEHEYYGDECANLIVDGRCDLILEDVFNSFDDLREHFDDKNHLKNAEMDLEQNYNAIDGVINNEKPKEKASVLDKLQNAKLQEEDVPKKPKVNER